MACRVLSASLVVLVGTCLVAPSAAWGQDVFDVQVDVDVTQDPQSGLFTYEYTVTNSAQSTQSLRAFRVTTNARGAIESVESPVGWSGRTYKAFPLVGWWATGGIVDLPEGDPNSGDIIPSPFQLAPGQSLGGFKLTSELPPVDSVFLALPFVALPEVADVEDLPPEAQQGFIASSLQGPTSAPGTDPTCNPLGGDSDLDGVCEFEDNCPFVANPAQADSGGLGGGTPDGVGDACQCGDGNDDGVVSSLDVDLLADVLIGVGAADADKCSIAGSGECDLIDLVVLRRSLAFGRSLAQRQHCPATRP